MKLIMKNIQLFYFIFSASLPFLYFVPSRFGYVALFLLGVDFNKFRFGCVAHVLCEVSKHFVDICVVVVCPSVCVFVESLVVLNRIRQHLVVLYCSSCFGLLYLLICSIACFSFILSFMLISISRIAWSEFNETSGFAATLVTMLFHPMGVRQ